MGRPVTLVRMVRTGVFLLLLVRAGAVCADCRVNHVMLPPSPESGELSIEPLILINAEYGGDGGLMHQMASEQAELMLREEDNGHLHPLKVLESYHGFHTHAVMVAPAHQLPRKRTFHLFLTFKKASPLLLTMVRSMLSWPTWTNAPDPIPTSLEFPQAIVMGKYRTIEPESSDTESELFWRETPYERNRKFQAFGCGPEIFVEFGFKTSRVPGGGFVHVALHNLDTTQPSANWVFPAASGTINIGHDMCAGSFKLVPNAQYRAVFSLVNTRGLVHHHSVERSFRAPHAD